MVLVGCWLDRLGQDGNPIINRRKSANVAALELLARKPRQLERMDVSGVGTKRIGQVEGVTAWSEGVTELKETRNNQKSMGTAARRKRRRKRWEGEGGKEKV